MAFSVLAAILAVTVRNLFHAALCFAAVLIGIAGVFLSLHADFLAMVQILIYVGAVMTLVIFAIMLTERFGDNSSPQNNSLTLAAFGLAIVSLIAFSTISVKTRWPIQENAGALHLSVGELAYALLNTYVLPFEVISVLLITTLIGAVIIAKKDRVS